VKCTEFEKLLIKKNIDEISDAEALLLHEHLESCKTCQNYQHTLIKLQKSVQIDEADNLIPEPAIRKNIAGRIKTNHRGVHEIVLAVVKSVLEYRIPVYQTLLGIAGIFLIVLAVNRFSLLQPKETAMQQGNLELSELAFEQMNVHNNLQVMDYQKIGININEDTSMTKFIVSSI